MITTEQLNSICKQCGMCCDGTLFRHAKILDEADKKAAAELGLTITKDKEHQPYFLQPCPCFKTYCTVYENRPKVCISFFCPPLLKAQKGLISFEEANTIIQSALTLRAEIRALASTIEDFKGLSIQELYEETTPQPSDRINKHPLLLLKLGVFRIKMLEHKQVEL
jgi:uncharacterized protein